MKSFDELVKATNDVQVNETVNSYMLVLHHIERAMNAIKDKDIKKSLKETLEFISKDKNLPID